MTRLLIRNFGAALSFNGGTDKVTVAHASALNVTTDFTLAGWVKLRSLKNDNRVFEKNYTLSVHNNGKLRCTLPGLVDIDDTGSATVPLGTWAHIAATKTGSTYKFYINGVLNSTVTDSTSLATATTSLYIGFSNLNNANSLNGLLDEPGIWNIVLTAAQILNLMNGSIPATGLVGIWLFNEGSGSSAADTGALYTGTISGAAWTTDVVVKARLTA